MSANDDGAIVFVCEYFVRARMCVYLSVCVLALTQTENSSVVVYSMQFSRMKTIANANYTTRTQYMHKLERTEFFQGNNWNFPALDTSDQQTSLFRTASYVRMAPENTIEGGNRRHCFANLLIVSSVDTISPSPHVSAKAILSRFRDDLLPRIIT